VDSTTYRDLYKLSTTRLEIETKFYVRDLKRIETRLQALGARLIQPRVHERNLRFDLPDGSLDRSKRVLRLRSDVAFTLTYKGPGTVQDGIRAREELEVTVSDFEIAERILSALGYQIILIYEKYRMTYQLGRCQIMLDEMPYGMFVEIEGDDNDSIHSMADKLGLKREAAISASYQALFDRVRVAMAFEFRDLTFENFEKTNVLAAMLGVQPAD
jgi:adenylate cyclase class 2